jgi:hypothetical protein
MTENRVLISSPVNLAVNRTRYPTRILKSESEERPLSAYDNLIESLNRDFIFSDIKFQFDKFPSMISNNTTNMQHNNHLENQGCNQTSLLPAATTTISTIDVEASDSNCRQYENVFETIQARNQNQRVENRNFYGKPVISDAKSSFFGLTNQSTNQNQQQESEDELDQLIQETETYCGQIMSNSNSKNQYVNLDCELNDLNKSSEDSTARIGSSSSNASSASTITPSQSPRKLSQSGSKCSSGNVSTRSPKFTLPREDPPSQVSFRD